MAAKMPTIQTFMTKEDERSFSKLVTERFPDATIIEIFIWPTPVPVVRDSVADCSSSSVAILKTGITSLDFYCRNWIRRREESNGYEGPDIGPGIIQYFPSEDADYDPGSLRNGRLSATYDPEREPEMDVFVKEVYKIFKENAIDLYFTDRRTGKTNDKAQRGFLAWPNAAQNYDGKNGHYLTSHALAYFVTKPSTSSIKKQRIKISTSTESRAMPARLSYEESWHRFQDLENESVPAPPMPDHIPRPDDDILGVRFFKTLGEGEDFSNVTLPRTFFGHSEFNDTSFYNADLTESNMCWNDFIDVDFSNAILVGCDARSSLFSKVTFASANLSRADLRHSTFEDCDFTGAQMHGTILTRKQGTSLVLSSQQKAEIAWTDDEGKEPDGG
jgi:hypothetical protein